MTEKVEPNALLLQVMAHDLLAPLTAVKWQMELLNKSGIDARKRDEYASNIVRSTELGITLTKHAHIASRILLGSYSFLSEQGTLHTALTEAAESIVEQYARHGLTLSSRFTPEAEDRMLDAQLTSFYIWLIGKYFLTLSPAGTLVKIVGAPSEYGEEGKYLITASATPIEHAEQYPAAFTSEEATDTYDQTFVFSRLLRTVSPVLGAELHIESKEKDLQITTTL
jgi:signal transduction histidine kinase